MPMGYFSLVHLYVLWYPRYHPTMDVSTNDSLVCIYNQVVEKQGHALQEQYTCLPTVLRIRKEQQGKFNSYKAKSERHEIQAHVELDTHNVSCEHVRIK